ncbi:MAG: EAL domain-containing protein [Thomasclavelia sp.]|uniref:sensor domain-containing phosphodiesterase n=1 Tax=Thomasclavelia sp. TaxID=3025757 RepID=UPI0039A28BF4
MKNIFSKLKVGLLPIILCIALITTGLMSIRTINSLEGNARVINYTGIVRGATQRLIKKELNYEADDALISYLDKILYGLANGSKELDLICINDDQYQSLLIKMNKEWNIIKDKINSFRNGTIISDDLFEASEEYFILADSTVMAAEEYTENVVEHSRKSLICMNMVFILITGLCAFLAFHDEKRRRKLVEAENINRQKSELLSKRFKELLVPMNEISELMYVADIDTYELLFINDAGKKTFHITGNLHQKCYKVLQGFGEPCPFCPNAILKIDENYTWEYTNPLTKRHYLLKDRLIEWEGRIARMEIAFDITDTANEKNELRNRLNRDNVLIQCIRELYHNNDIKDATNHILEQVGKLFSAERVYVILFHDNKFSNTSEWCREDIIPQIDNLQNIPLSNFMSWYKLFVNKQNIVIKNLEDIKLSMKKEYEFLYQQKIERVIMVPLERDGKTNGCIGLDNSNPDLMESAVTFLETLRYYLMLAIRRDEDKKALYCLSYQDRLTSFYNRNRYIQDISQLEGKDDSVGIVYLDINGLKEVNDHFGHDSGDDLLKKCTKIIKQSFKIGSFYRIGGDEFIIICTNISKTDFNENVCKLRNNFLIEDCTVAIGSKWERNCKKIQTVIKTADELMYSDKKGYYHSHHETGRYRHSNDLLLFLSNIDLFNAKLANGQFQVYLQAKVNVESRNIVGAEALVRYIDDEGIIQGPDKFIPVLENSFQISKIDFYVFEKICAQLQEWKIHNKTLFPVSSNFSRNTFMEDDFLERLETIVAQYSVPKKYLEVEITESMCLIDYKSLKNRINKIREAGFQVSVDDFGTDSSNLALLAMAKFDILKIDKSFVKDIISNKHAQTIVEAMVGVCDKINIQLIAEGVENELQLEVLKKCGVKTVQGFLFSKPIPMNEYEWKYLNM